MDNRNLRQEQRDALDEALTLIDGVLDRMGPRDDSEIIKQLHHARNNVNAVVSGERTELGPRL